MSALPARVASPVEDFPQWYGDVIDAAQLVDVSPVRGCSVLRPASFAMWEAIQASLDARIKATGVQNAYFPALIPQSFFAKEAEHVAGFATECAVVTHHRLSVDRESGAVAPDPASLLAEPLVLRPTSETTVWHSFARWVQSHADLPLLVNQWANIVRWEMHTRPFLRTTEFLWQEGHTAHACEAEALRRAVDMAAVYADFVDAELGLGALVGAKPAGDRFAGALETFTLEGMMANGWALQCGTSHFLGQNFAKAFGVQFAPPQGARGAGVPQHVWATSWGMTTRLIGAVIMTHSDGTGLVLPPPLAATQVVVAPIAPSARKARELGVDTAAVLAAARAVGEALGAPPPGRGSSAVEAAAAAGAALHAAPRGGSVRAHVDDRTRMKPGVRFYEWERKGVPLRIDVGAGEVAGGHLTARVRHSGEAVTLPVPGGLVAGEPLQAALQGLLQAHVSGPAHSRALWAAAVTRRRAKTYAVTSLDAIEAHLTALGAHPAQEGTSAARTASTPRAGGQCALAGLPPSLHAASSVAGHWGVPDTADGAPLGWYAVPWADDAANEEALKARTRLTVRCLPAALNSGSPLRRPALWAGPAQLGSPGLVPGVSTHELQAGDAELEARLLTQPCIVSGKPATHVAIVGRAY
ncbi:hypothetical protein BU14_1378s0001 [Porphyra umbilicalis]|uniref:proline--tRNA ligase n=1 Tax=Porphyra umbilicalis TaxID=2786 RepID=A0A1X6NLQ7_PORUM|nr:hypothetical protein BU14_1378s0001 [Porphyra umbilicalis]|eukprot:OSX69579.1 hypothetical protein BU14_1378s0001 [Porphyra umbilicalis]